MEQPLHIADLIYKEISENISEKEIAELEAWKNASHKNMAIYTKAKDTDKQLKQLEVYQLFDSERVWGKLEKELFEGRTVVLPIKRVMRIAAAILFPLFIAGGVWFYMFNNSHQVDGLAKLDQTVKPGTQKAVLVMSDGGEVDLEMFTDISDNAEKSIAIKNEGNSLKYFAKELKKKTKQLVFNELITPRGGGYNLTLADGSVVWLNSGSKLRFPVSFSDSVRQVFLSGEAYFDVMPGDIPFIVTTNDMDVKVLGTSFNVSAYQDDQQIKTTLVEGKVQINLTGSNNNIGHVLTPNKQAVLDKISTEVAINNVNVTMYTSWKEGVLDFNNEDLDQVMKKLSRWYDFDYDFENQGAKDLHFTARFNKQDSITNILKMLEMTTKVQFEYKDNSLVIL